MRRSHLSIHRRLLAAGSLAALLLGTGILSQTRGASGASIQAPTPQNTLSIGWNTETRTLDPGGNSQNPDIWVQVNMFDRLVTVGADGKTIKPDLATSWKLSNGG